MEEQRTLPLPVSSVKPFIPRPRSKRVNWRKLGSVNLDALAQHGDHSELQSHLAYVTFCDVEAEFAGRSNDPGLVKLFRLAQLELEYLLHTQDILASSVEELANKCQEAEGELEKLRKERKVLKAALLKSSAASSPCPECPKVFSTQDFLEAHLSRRHGGGNASTELLDVNRRLEADLKFLREEISDLRNRKISCDCNHHDQQPQQPTLSAAELKKIIAFEMDSKLASFLANHAPLPPQPQVVTVQSPMPPPPPPVDVNQLRDDICGKMSSELASVKRQLLNQDQFWKEQISNMEKVQRLELEGIKEKIEEAVKEKAESCVVNPMYSSEDVLNRILESQKRQEELLKAQENELVQLKEDNKRRDASAASLLSLTASKQFGLGRSYEEIGTSYQTEPTMFGLAPKTPDRPSSANASKPTEPPQQLNTEVRPVLLSKSDEKLVVNDQEDDVVREEEEILDDSGEEEDEEELEEAKKKKGRFGGLMKSIRQSLSLSKKRPVDSPTGSRRKLDFGSSKQFTTSTPKKLVQESDDVWSDKNTRDKRDKDNKRQAAVGSANRSDELVGHWWADDGQVDAGSRRLLKMADWSSPGKAASTSMASLPPHGSDGMVDGDKKFATLPARRTKPSSGRKSVSFVDDFPDRSRREQNSEDDEEGDRPVGKSLDNDASAETTKTSVEELCRQLGPRRPQSALPQSKPVPVPRVSVESASGRQEGDQKEESSWDDSSDDER